MITLDKINKLDCFINATKAFSKMNLEVSTDSRHYNGQSLFVAISGVNFNAFEFIEKVVDQGCVNIAFTNNDLNNDLLKEYVSRYPHVNFIRVKDSILLLQQLANVVSIEFQKKGKKLICISGSNGKTTTKEMLYSILKNLGTNVICTQKNNNNHIGVPLTIFQITEDVDYAIVELGSNHPGEIKTLCEIAAPSIGVTTNIGYTHMEFFSSLEKVFEEEAYLYTYIDKFCSFDKKLFFQNYDDEYLSKLDKQNFCIGFGSSESELEYKFDITSKVVKILYGDINYEVNNPNITGKHNFYNLCVSIAVAHKITKIPIEKVLRAAQEFSPTKNRSQWTKLKTSNIFLDAYNANPSSMRASLNGFYDYISSLSQGNKKSCVILGDMNELGVDTAMFHEKLGTDVVGMNFDKVIFVGRFANDYRNAIPQESSVEIYSSVEELKKQFNQNVIGVYDYVFIKGSRSLQLESLIDIT